MDQSGTLTGITDARIDVGCREEGLGLFLASPPLALFVCTLERFRPAMNPPPLEVAQEVRRRVPFACGFPGCACMLCSPRAHEFRPLPGGVGWRVSGGGPGSVKDGGYPPWTAQRVAAALQRYDRKYEETTAFLALGTGARDRAVLCFDGGGDGWLLRSMLPISRNFQGCVW